MNPRVILPMLVGTLLSGMIGIDAKSAPLCSGYSPLHYQAIADVVAIGTISPAENRISEMVVARRVLKGRKQRGYRIVWPPVDHGDECAFLYPARRDRGVFFLQERDDGAYDVLWTEDRWTMVR